MRVKQNAYVRLFSQELNKGRTRKLAAPSQRIASSWQPRSASIFWAALAATAFSLGLSDEA